MLTSQKTFCLVLSRYLAFFLFLFSFVVFFCARYYSIKNYSLIFVSSFLLIFYFDACSYGDDFNRSTDRKREFENLSDPQLHDTFKRLHIRLIGWAEL